VDDSHIKNLIQAGKKPLMMIGFNVFFSPPPPPPINLVMWLKWQSHVKNLPKFDYKQDMQIKSI
jgi:hypothetical protein